MKRKPKSKKRTALRHFAVTVANLTRHLAKTVLIVAVCLWFALNSKFEYDGGRALKTAEKVGKSWMGKTVEGVKGAIDLVKAVN